jgi:hypothetical protein
MPGEYKARGGALCLGGEQVKRSKKHKKSSKHSKKEKRERDDSPSQEPSKEVAKEETAATPSNPPPIVVLSGTGRISTSGTTVLGHEGTKFLSELHAGDAIIVTHPVSLVSETRIVKMVVSNVSIGISSAFSTDLISTVTFRYVKTPEALVKEPKRPKKTGAEEDDSYGAMEGLKAQDGTFSYRVMRHGKTGYDIVTEDVGERSREDLLNTRSKKKADRMCM